jgi:N-acetylmuramoyl-L-alanine amidase
MKKLLLNFVAISLTVSLSAIATTFFQYEQRNIFMIAPAGHAGQLGRKLSHGYERGTTLKFAENLQKKFLNNAIKIYLSRSPGETLIPLQTASFANRLNVKLLVSLHIYQKKSAKPGITIYQYCVNPLTDFVKRTTNKIEFIPIEQAHIKSCSTTQKFCQQLKTILTQKENQKLFNFYGPYAIPIKPLVGISPPAIALEIGVNDELKLEALLEPIVEGLSTLASSYDFQN